MIVANRMISVRSTIATRTLPVRTYSQVSRMKSAWKIGVNSQLRKLNGSVGELAASGAGVGVGVGDGEVAGKPLDPGEAIAEAATPADGPELELAVPASAHAMTASATSTTRSPSASQRTRDIDVRF